MYTFDELKVADPEIAQAIEDEVARQNSHIELIASEICRRLSGKTLLWRLWMCGCGRKPCH